VQDPNQYDDLDEVDRRSDVRLLDSLIMTVQLNVRKLLQARSQTLALTLIMTLTYAGQSSVWRSACGPLVTMTAAVFAPAGTRGVLLRSCMPLAKCVIATLARVCGQDHKRSTPLAVLAGGGRPGHQCGVRAAHGRRSANAF